MKRRKRLKEGLKSIQEKILIALMTLERNFSSQFKKLFTAIEKQQEKYNELRAETQRTRAGASVSLSSARRAHQNSRGTSSRAVVYRCAITGSDSEIEGFGERAARFKQSFE